MKAEPSAKVFFISKRRVKTVWWSMLVFGLGALFYSWQVPAAYAGGGIGAPWWLWALAALSFGFVSLHRAWVLGHRRRPVVHIGTEELEWGSTYHLTSRRHRIPFRDLRSIRWKNSNVIRLGTASGGEISLRIAEISAEERVAVFESISNNIDSINPTDTAAEPRPRPAADDPRTAG